MFQGLISSAIWSFPVSQMTSSNAKLPHSSVAQLCLTLCDTIDAARQVSLSITNSQSLLKLMSIKSVIPSNHLILCCPPLFPPSIFASIRVFSNESFLRIRWPKDWSFSFSISPSNEYSGLISFRMDWLDLPAVQGLSRVFSNTTVQKHQFLGAQLSLQSNSHIHTGWLVWGKMWWSDHSLEVMFILSHEG